MWGNVVTVNGDNVTYWTWIPRFKYNITASKGVNVEFVDLKGNCKHRINDEDVPINVNDFKLSEAFEFAGKDLKGYWISKYEIQVFEESNLEKIKVVTRGNTTTVTTTAPNGRYTIYIDGEKTAQRENVELPYTITGLNSNQQYDITLYSETNKRMVGSTNMRTSYNIEVDLSGFNPKCTYYVVYDKEGNLIDEKTRIQLDSNGKATNIPEGWYDYDNKIWANIVTVNGDNVTYWTYIPRYEYSIIYGSGKIVEVRFINDKKTTADSCYKIPESFNFAGKDLKGYWISKYELQDTNSAGLEKLQVEVDGTSVNVTTSSPSGNYTILVNGEKSAQRENVQLPYTITGLERNKEYEITVYSETNKRMVGSKGIEIPEE